MADTVTVQFADPHGADAPQMAQQHDRGFPFGRQGMAVMVGCSAS